MYKCSFTFTLRTTYCSSVSIVHMFISDALTTHNKYAHNMYQLDQSRFQQTPQAMSLNQGYQK